MKAQFNGYIRAISEKIESEDTFKHPLQSTVEFIFTDFLPNANKQGVPRSEAANIIQTGMFMPILVSFNGDGVGDHENTLPIGAITHMEQTEENIISKGVLWPDIFPDVVDHLKSAVASEGGVQFSWELYHKGSDIDTTGVSWLTGCVVAGTAIVNTPAYSGRTPLLSIASQRRLHELEQELAQLRKEHAITRSDMSPEEMKKLIDDAFKEQIELFFQRITPATAELTVLEESEEVKSLRAKIVELEAFKNGIEEKEAQAVLRSARSEALKDFLSAEDFAKQEEFIFGLSDEQFTKYVENISQIAKQSKASAGKIGGLIPDPVISSGGDTPSIPELAKALREEFKKR